MSAPATFQEKDSKFVSYTKICQTHQAVQQGYLKIRLLHPKARHVICAYQIQNDAEQEWEGCDDQEYGAYRNVLQMMKDNDLKSRAFYYHVSAKSFGLTDVIENIDNAVIVRTSRVN